MPDEEKEDQHASHHALGHVLGASRRRLPFEILQERLEVRVVVGAQDPDEARPVIEPCSERPLVHDRRPSVVVPEHEPQREEDRLGHPGDVKYYEVRDGVQHELEHHAVRLVVAGRVDGHHDVDGQEPVGVHGADVIQDVLVGEHGAQDEHEEVEAEQHLHDPQRGVVLLDPEEGEVTCNKRVPGEYIATAAASNAEVSLTNQ